jgi:hypothetical protein
MLDNVNQARKHLEHCVAEVRTMCTEGTDRQCDFDGAHMTRTSTECGHGVIYREYVCPDPRCSFRKAYSN